MLGEVVLGEGVLEVYLEYRRLYEKQTQEEISSLTETSLPLTRSEPRVITISGEMFLCH